jgi:hypothetical protein
MMRQSGLYFLVIVLAISCSSPSESNSERQNNTAASWTDSFNKNGFEDLSLSSEDVLPEGWSRHSIDLALSEEKKLSALQEVRMHEGKLRELRITFQPVTGTKLDSLFAKVNARMVNLYGSAKPTKAYSSWQAATQNGTLMEIEVMDARQLFQRNEIIVHWKEYEDRRYEE